MTIEFSLPKGTRDRQLMVLEVGSDEWKAVGLEKEFSDGKKYVMAVSEGIEIPIDNMFSVIGKERGMGGVVHINEFKPGDWEVIDRLGELLIQAW